MFLYILILQFFKKWEMFRYPELDCWQTMLKRLYKKELEQVVLWFEEYRAALTDELNRQQHILYQQHLNEQQEAEQLRLQQQQQEMNIVHQQQQQQLQQQQHQQQMKQQQQMLWQKQQQRLDRQQHHLQQQQLQQPSLLQQYQMLQRNTKSQPSLLQFSSRGISSNILFESIDSLGDNLQKTNV